MYSITAVSDDVEISRDVDYTPIRKRIVRTESPKTSKV